MYISTVHECHCVLYFRGMCHVPPYCSCTHTCRSSSLPTLEQLSGRLSPEAGGGGGLETRLTALQDEVGSEYLWCVCLGQ